MDSPRNGSLLLEYLLQITKCRQYGILKYFLKLFFSINGQPRACGRLETSNNFVVPVQCSTILSSFDQKTETYWATALLQSQADAKNSTNVSQSIRGVQYSTFPVPPRGPRVLLVPPFVDGNRNPAPMSTVGHKSHDPCFHKKYMVAGVMTFVGHCTSQTNKLINERGKTLVP